MGWFWISLGGFLFWIGVSALRGLAAPKFLSKREVGEALHGKGSPPITDHLEMQIRTRWLVQADSMAQLFGLAFFFAGLGLIILGTLLIFES